MKILYEDNHLLIVEKPPGLLTQPTEHESDSLETRAIEYLKRETGKESVFLKSVHRLDREVGGVVIFAKSSKCVSRMAERVRERKIEKRYRAEVEGAVESESGTLVHYLEKGDHRAHVYDRERRGAKMCELKFRVAERREHSTIVDIELVSGRYHQIRAQWAHVGHPVVGDRKYGSTMKGPKEGICLAHTRCAFQHPTKQEEIAIGIKSRFF